MDYILICRTNTTRKQGGLGEMKIPLMADLTKSICTDYGVLKEDDGIAYRSDGALMSPATYWVVRYHCAFCVCRWFLVPYCKPPVCLSGVCLWSTTKASWGRSPSMTCLSAARWMKLCVWSRPSSSLTNMGKVSGGGLAAMPQLYLNYYFWLFILCICSWIIGIISQLVCMPFSASWYFSSSSSLTSSWNNLALTAVVQL